MLKTASMILVLSGLVSVASLYAAGPYAGQQHREIKALSVQDIQGLSEGSGMGMAKVAELNHYPGPKHVLELADKLELSKQQRQKTQAVFSVMQRKAVKLGKEVIALEQKLDQLFASQKIDSGMLNQLMHKIAQKRGALRGVHLQAHLEQRQILTPEQLQHYDQLRGYTNGHQQEHHHQH